MTARRMGLMALTALGLSACSAGLMPAPPYVLPAPVTAAAIVDGRVTAEEALAISDARTAMLNGDVRAVLGAFVQSDSLAAAGAPATRNAHPAQGQYRNPRHADHGRFSGLGGQYAEA